MLNKRIAYLRQTILLLLAVALLLLPLTIKLVNVVVLLAAVLSCYYTLFLDNSGTFKKRWDTYKWLIMCWLLFVCLHIFAAFAGTQPIESWFRLAEKKLFLAIMPLAILFLPAIQQKEYVYLRLLAIAGTLLAVGFSFKEGIAPFLAEEAELQVPALLVMSRPYLGLFCGFAIFCCLSLLQEAAVTWHKLLLAATVFFLLWFCVLIVVKSALLLTFFIVVVLALGKLYKTRPQHSAVLAFSLLLGAVLVLVINADKLRPYLDLVLGVPPAEGENIHWMISASFYFRHIIWSCSAEVLFQSQVWLTGFAGEPYSQLTDQCYAQKVTAYAASGITFEKIRGMKSHNQYLNVWLECGLPGLFTLLAAFALSFWHMIKRGNPLGMALVALVALACLTQDVLNVHKGAMFFAVYHALLLAAPGAVRALPRQASTARAG